MRRLLTSPIVAALSLGALTACGGGDDPKWYDARDEASPAVPGTTLFEDADVRVVESTGAGDDCVQLTVRDVSLFCVSNGMDTAGGYSAAARRLGDLRFIDLRTGPTARSFVVWSSASPSGRAVEPIRSASGSLLVWFMEPGEEPWGVQIIDDGDGSLGSAVSFVGLPGR
jgi:hypothetical protein